MHLELRTAFAWIGVAGQIGLGAAGLAWLSFAPPEQGEMLLIPLNGQPVSPALFDQVPLYPGPPGPLPGSVVVSGSGTSLFTRFLAEGILIIAAPRPLCQEVRPVESRT